MTPRTWRIGGHVWALCSVGWLIAGLCLTKYPEPLASLGALGMTLGIGCGAAAALYWWRSTDA